MSETTPSTAGGGNVKEKLGGETFKAGKTARVESKKYFTWASGKFLFLMSAMIAVWGIFVFIPNVGNDEDGNGGARSLSSRDSSRLLTPSWVGTQKTLVLTSNEWSIIRVTGDRCIKWWRTDPDGEPYLTEVRGIETDAKWYSWNEWVSLRNNGEITYNFGWVRHKALNATAKVTQEFGLPGECS